MIPEAAPFSIFLVMPKHVRIEFPGAYYHVIARGDRREDIYLSDAERTEVPTMSGNPLQPGLPFVARSAKNGGRWVR